MEGEFRLPRWRSEWPKAHTKQLSVTRNKESNLERPSASFRPFKLADMATEIDAARWLVYRAAWLADQKGPRFTKESSMAKLYASEVGVRVASEAVQIFGGYGFIKDYPVEKFYRDSKLCTIGEGTSEIQRMVIARQILDKD